MQDHTEQSLTIPLEAGTAHHWLAVDGRRPATAENAQPHQAKEHPCQTGLQPKPLQHQRTTAHARAQAHESTSNIAGLPLKHSLSSELQLYFGMVRHSLQKLHKGQPGLLPPRAVTASLATDPGSSARAACNTCSMLSIHSISLLVPGLQPVLPYLVPLLSNEVQSSMDNLNHLEYVLR